MSVIYNVRRHKNMHCKVVQYQILYAYKCKLGKATTAGAEAMFRQRAAIVEINQVLPNVPVE